MPLRRLGRLLDPDLHVCPELEFSPQARSVADMLSTRTDAASVRAYFLVFLTFSSCFIGAAKRNDEIDGR